MNPKVLGALFAAYTLVTGFLIGLLVVVPSSLLLLIPHHGKDLFQSATAHAVALYLRLPTTFLEVIGVKMSFYGFEGLPQDESALWISNHPTELDWMFLWAWAARFSSLPRLKIVLKESLRAGGPWGWAMQLVGYLFLRRDKAHDEVHMKEVVAAHMDSTMGAHLLIFPEGTNLHESTLKKSHDFQQKNNKPIWNNVLYPRVTGLTFVLPTLRRRITAVYNFTLGYKPELPSPVGVVSGKIPSEVHFSVERIPIKNVPETEEELGTFVEGLFARKEQALEQFNKTGSFAEPKVADNQPALFRYLLLGVTAFLGLYGLYLLATSCLVQLLAAAGTVGMIVATHIFGGADRLLWRKWGQEANRSRSASVVGNKRD